MPRLLLVATLLFTLALAACSGKETPDAVTSPTPAGATPSPSPSATAPPVASGVSTTLNASCAARREAAEITVSFSVSAAGGNLSRVRLMMDGAVADDSGPLRQPEYRRVKTYEVPFGARRSFQLITESGGRESGARVSSTVQCPDRPTPTPGPRA